MQRFKRLSLALSVGSMLAIGASQSFAQCSGGGRGGGSVSPSPSNGLLSSLAAQPAFAYQQPSTLMMQQQLYQQQRLLAMQAQQMRFLAQQRYDQQRDLIAGRLARAEAKREARAERIAARIRSRNAEASDGSSATVLAASQIVPSSVDHSVR